MLKTTLETVSSREMAAIELNAQYLGVSSLQLMENAGCAVARCLASRFKPQGTRVVVFTGVGGNGGDGFVTARHLASLGYSVTILLLGRPEEIKRSDVRSNWEAVLSMADSVKVMVVHDSSQVTEASAEVLVDAMLGTGAVGPLRPPILQAVSAFNNSSGFKVAVDVPTGVDADTGEVVREAVRADLTVTFHKSKLGLLRAREYSGEVVVEGIGIPREAEMYAGPGDVVLVHKPRPPGAHKGDFGRLLVVGGSETFSGAPTLAALAALRTGVDIVYVAAPEKTAHDISGMAPDLITVKLDGDHLNPENVVVVWRFIDVCDAVVMGPGLGLHEETVRTVEMLVGLAERGRKPFLLDADALKAFAGFKHRVDFPVVFTPHAGEYRILTGEEPSRQLQERVAHLQRNANALNAVILLKGHVDIISDGVRVKLNTTGNPGMTVGGTGDTLSGIVGALLAQGFSPFESSVAGAFVNGAAGDFAARDRGYHLIPSDLIDYIPRVIDEPMSHRDLKKPTL